MCWTPLYENKHK